MEQFIIDQVKYALRYLPFNAIKAKVIPQFSSETVRLRERLGFIRGVCHPNETYDQLKAAHIEWIRIDIPFPYDENGELSQSYLDFKERCKGYVERDIKVMAVSPLPNAFLRAGIDCADYSNDEKISEISRFLINDLRDCIAGVQVANEIGHPLFTLPVKFKDAARFVGICLKAMYPIRGDIIIGYNSTSPQADLHYLLKPYHRYCDYVGMDIYMGCFFSAPGVMAAFDVMLDYLWAYTGKPVLLCEFGYIGDGKAKTKEEKLAILRKYGVGSEAEARANIVDFVERLPSGLKSMVKLRSFDKPENYADILFGSDLVNHLYCELPGITKIPGYEHTPEGQAKFYRDILPRMHKKKYLIGTIIFSYNDQPRCYQCSQEECPTETKWGLVDCEGREKPAYYAVQEAYGKIAEESPAIKFKA